MVFDGIALAAIVFAILIGYFLKDFADTCDHIIVHSKQRRNGRLYAENIIDAKQLNESQLKDWKKRLDQKNYFDQGIVQHINEVLK